MTSTILVAVSDSPAAFAAAHVAIDQARRLGARVHAVTVVESSVAVPRAGAETTGDGADVWSAADAALRHVVVAGTAAGVQVTARRRVGNVAAEVLDEARVVSASMIVMACVDRPGGALPYIGSQTLRVLEFAEVPVLVVPVVPPSRAR